MGRPRVRFVQAAALAAALAAPLAAAAAVGGPTELISVGPDGRNPATARGFGALSADGRLVAFDSAGTDIDPSNANPYGDVYVKDRVTGAFDRVSRSASGGDANGASTIFRGGMSADGNLVAFTSTASNLVDHDVNLSADVFVRDRAAGQTRTVSLGPAGLDSNGRSYDAAISADGRHVAFVSEATNLLATPDLNGKPDVFVRDLQTGVTQLVSATPGGLPAGGVSGAPAISADGTRVAFQSTATDLVAGDTNGRSDIFVRDLTSGQTSRVSVSDTGAQANLDSVAPAISGDGSLVAFVTNASNLGGVKYSTGSMLYLRDLTRGRTERVLTESGLEHTNGGFSTAAIDATGRFVAFASNSTSFVPMDNTLYDIFVLDRATDRIDVVSRALDGRVGNGHATTPAIAADGSAVGFLSTSRNLVPGYPNLYNPQVFLRPLAPEALAADSDGDGVANIDDTCPRVADPGQEDTDREGRGDACDRDDDSDALTDDLEPLQDTDPLLFDTDGDGVADGADDYPADPERQVGTEHLTLNVAHLDFGGGRSVVATLRYDASARKFDVKVEGTLPADVPSASVVVYRRAPGIRERRLCVLKANAEGVAACSVSTALGFFTTVEVRDSANAALAAVEPERPLANG